MLLLDNNNLFIIFIILLIIISIILIIIISLNYYNREKFNINPNNNLLYDNMRLNNCSPLNNMTNNNRLNQNNIGPVYGFHKCFNGGYMPELGWRHLYNAKYKSIDYIPMYVYNKKLQPINPIDNIYSKPKIDY